MTRSSFSGAATELFFDGGRVTHRIRRSKPAIGPIGVSDCGSISHTRSGRGERAAHRPARALVSPGTEGVARKEARRGLAPAQGSGNRMNQLPDLVRGFE